MTQQERRSESGHDERNGVFVVIAAFEEARKIGEVVASVLREYPNVVVVDDGSEDGTFDSAKAAGARTLRHALNRGQGAALQTGIAYALRHGAEIVVTFDADGQHEVADIAAMIEPIRNGEVQVTLGSRFLGEAVNLPTGRRIVLRLAIIFGALTSGVMLSDAHNGFRAFSRSAAQQIDIQLDRMAHASEIVDQIRHRKLSYKEIPVRIQYTEYSMAKGQPSRRAVRIAFDYLVGKVLR